MRCILILCLVFGLCRGEESVPNRREYKDPGALFYHARILGTYPLIVNGEVGISYNLSSKNPSNNIEAFTLNGPTLIGEFGINGYGAGVGYTFGMFSMVGGLNANLSANYRKVFNDNFDYYNNTDYLGATLGISFSILYGRIGIFEGKNGDGNGDIVGSYAMGVGW